MYISLQHAYVYVDVTVCQSKHKHKPRKKTCTAVKATGLDPPPLTHTSVQIGLICDAEVDTRRAREGRDCRGGYWRGAPGIRVLMRAAKLCHWRLQALRGGRHHVGKGRR
jgi:hypothetical protein